LTPETKRLAAKALIGSLGWKAGGTPPTAKKAVIIAAPHTSNLDGVLLVSFAWNFGVDIQWMVKDSVMSTPLLGRLVNNLGGVAIDRSQSKDVVSAMVRAMQESEELLLVVSPPGTRSRREHWKSGFYWIAQRAGVPLVCSYLDYAKKEGGFGPTIPVTGNVKADMDRLREFYAGVSARHPEQVTPVRLASEE
jgi:1-acyl-sn-glycerol-3-phosphate acyltransferase